MLCSVCSSHSSSPNRFFSEGFTSSSAAPLSCADWLYAHADSLLFLHICVLPGTRTYPAVPEVLQGLFLSQNPPEFEFLVSKAMQEFKILIGDGNTQYRKDRKNEGTVSSMISAAPRCQLCQGVLFNPSALRKGHMDAVYF